MRFAAPLITRLCAHCISIIFITSCALGASLTISNTTHPELSPYLYLLNDNVQIVATGNPGDQITVAVGSSLTTLGTPALFATIPTGGTYTSTPSAQGTAGTFYQQWFVAGVPMGNAVTIVVASTPFAVLKNTYHTNLTPNFEVQDTYSLSVVGAPNATVYAASGQNGAALGTPVSVGITDSTGLKLFTGTFTSTQAGNWVEKWCVSSISNCTTITFSIVTAQSKDYIYLGGHIAAIENN